MDALDEVLALGHKNVVLFYQGFFCLGQRQYQGIPTDPTLLDEYKVMKAKSSHYEITRLPS